MEFEEWRMAEWEVLPRVHLLRIVRGPMMYVEIAHAGKFWRVPANDVRVIGGLESNVTVSLLGLPGGSLSLAEWRSSRPEQD